MDKFTLAILYACVAVTVGVPVTNEVFSLDNGAGIAKGKVLSVTVDPDTRTVGLAQFNVTDGEQRIIVRPNSDNTFTLFPDTQPWNWVDHIVELTKYVRIQKIPQVLTALGATKQVLEQNYQGKNTESQKWYLVPTGDDPNTGLITNLLLRQCIAGQGENQPLTLSICNFNDPNQVFTLSLRTMGRRT